MGVDFTIIEKKGPKIASPIRTAADAAAVRPLQDVESQVPFLGPILKVPSRLRRRTTSHVIAD
jgi:uroporphyrinogen-III decarboxylase